jgi:hypothetical protein
MTRLICTHTFHKDFLPVFWCSVIAFIEWLTVTSKLPCRIEFKLQILSLLFASTYWKEMIFDKASSSVSQSNLDAIFLSLVATRILEIQNTTDKIMWIVGWEAPIVQQQHARVKLVEATIGSEKYTMDIYWVEINQHPPTRVRVCTSPILIT